MDWATQTDDLAGFLSRGASGSETKNVLKQRRAIGRYSARLGAQSLLVSCPLPSSPASSHEQNSAPHPSILARDAFADLLAFRADQTIVVSGHRDSGKSVVSKIVSQQLIDLSLNGKKKSRVLSGAAKLEIVMDSFGSVQDPQCVHMLQFGRYTEYQYAFSGRMVGVKLSDYGLDKTRLTAAFAMNEGERNFHIFYQLIGGATPAMRETLKIHDSAFAYLKGFRNTQIQVYSNSTLTRNNTLSRITNTLSRSNTRNGKSTIAQSDSMHSAQDTANFSQLCENMKSLGIGSRTQSQIYKILAAILHLGNLIFFKDTNIETGSPCAIQNSETLDIVAELLDIGSTRLKNSLIYMSKLVGRETCSCILTPEMASTQRDKLAQTLYALVFSWLVEHINKRLCKSEDEVDSFVAIADFPWIHKSYGETHLANFDSFVSNYAAERLIHFTMLQHFEVPAKILSLEEIQVSETEYSDNQLTIDLFMGNQRLPGIWKILHEGINSPPTIDTPIGETIVKKMDSTLKANPHYITSVDANSNYLSATGEVRAVFAIRHYQHVPSVDYDLEGFLEDDATLTDFVGIFNPHTGDEENNEKTFLMELFSKSNGIQQIRTKKGRLVGSTKNLEPMRKPSIKHKIATDLASRDSEQNFKFKAAEDSVNNLIETLKGTRFWSIFCISSGETELESLESLNITQIANSRYKYDVDTTYGIKYIDFAEKYAPLLATVGGSRGTSEPKEIIASFISGQWWPTRDFAFGKSMIFLSHDRWRWLSVETKRFASEDLLLATNFLAPHESNSALDRNSEGPRHTENDDEDYRSEAGSQMESEFGFADEGRRIGINRLENRIDVEKGIPDIHGISGKKEAIVNVTEITRSRKIWVCMTWSLTWWIPSFCLGWFKMTRPDIRMAWREKVALCLIIFFLCCSLLFFIIGLSFIICPPVNVKSLSEVFSDRLLGNGGTVAFVSAYGRYYNVAPLMAQHLRDFGPNNGLSSLQPYQFTQFYGNDVSNLFYKGDSFGTYCPNIKVTPPQNWDSIDTGLPWMKRISINPKSALHRDVNSLGQPQPYIGAMNKYAVGRLGWALSTIQGIASTSVIIIVLFNNVYYLSTLSQLPTTTFDPAIMKLLTAGNTGQDITVQWKAAVKSSQNPQAFLDALNCLNNMFYIGTVDLRNSIQCQIAGVILLGSSIILCAVIGIKFLAALQFGIRKEPEEGDRFVICMVPCYTEGPESLTKTLESVATLEYDDKRKLLFVICDGMIIGAGNDRPTPRIVLDILGCDASQDPEPQSFQSLGEGNRQFNMGKVYSGLYECRGHSVPYIVVVKVGGPTERVKPGNRGKRDSQLVLMRFLNRVHFNAEFAPLELEIYHHMKNIIGVSPSFYEFAFFVDADTEVEPPAINRMVAVMVHDSKVMGLCGETRISNEKDSWVYEYFISHHLAKSFESLFGTVTCLPGCFTMYRIRSAQKNVPLFCSPGVLADYSENNVDTLHVKNLLHLGEDRYLTTLMLKHFPQMRTKFTGEARCSTNVPDQWSVLLSQRRRWINSTVHNLLELCLLDQLCGFCCFSMRFIVLLDLFSTCVQPATVLYIAYLIYAVAFSSDQFPLLSLILIGCVYGLQVIIFIIKRQWQHIAWMIIYILAIPIFSFYIPVYAFWHFDDFSWGNTRIVVGEGKKTVYLADTEPFNPKTIPLKRWRDFEEHEQWEMASQLSGVTSASYVTGTTHQSNNLRVPSHGVVIARQVEYVNGYPKALSSHSAADVPIVNKQRMSRLPPLYDPISSRSEPSDQDMYAETKKILAEADLMTLTKKQIREKLSVHFGCDLTHRKEKLNQIIDEILQTLMS